MFYKRFNQEVLFTKDKFVIIDRNIIEDLKVKSLKNKRKRIRLCTHTDINDELHEMFIVHGKNIYIRPHRHLKDESLHVLEGNVDLILFNKKGLVKNVIKMGTYSSGKKFYCRIDPSSYHTLIIKSDFLVFHEAKTGPFRKSDTEFAPWAPQEFDTEKVKIFQKNLKNQISAKGRSAFGGKNHG